MDCGKNKNCDILKRSTLTKQSEQNGNLCKTEENHANGNGELPTTSNLRLDSTECVLVPQNSILSNFSFSTTPNFEDIRKLQAEFVKERNWNQYHQPRNILLAMVGEVGEVAELFQWKDKVSEGLEDWSKEDKDHLAQELSDVLIYLVSLADKCHIDLPIAAVEKMRHNKQKYPVSKAWGSSKKYTEL